MDIDFPEFEKTPTLQAKRDTLDKAIEAESEVIQVAFRQNRSEARAIVDRIDKVWDKRHECAELLSRHDPRWYKSPFAYFFIGGVISALGTNDHGLRILGAMLALFAVGLYFRNLIERNHYSKGSDDADRAYEALEFRWRCLGNYSTLYFCIFYREQARLDALRPIPDREAYFEVWSHTANQWLNAERRILNQLTQRHSPYDSEWKNELDESQEDYLKRIRTLRG